MPHNQTEPCGHDLRLDDRQILRVSEVKDTYFGGKLSLRW